MACFSEDGVVFSVCIQQVDPLPSQQAQLFENEAWLCAGITHRTGVMPAIPIASIAAIVASHFIPPP